MDFSQVIGNQCNVAEHPINVNIVPFGFMAETHPQSLRQETSGRLLSPVSNDEKTSIPTELRSPHRRQAQDDPPVHVAGNPPRIRKASGQTNQLGYEGRGRTWPPTRTIARLMERTLLLIS